MSAIIVFNDKSEATKELFTQWKAAHPNAYFLNCRRISDKGRDADEQDRIHRLGHCRCRALDTKYSFPIPSWWKVCGPSPQTLLTWFVQNGARVKQSATHFCKNCFPGGGISTDVYGDVAEHFGDVSTADLHALVEEGWSIVVQTKTRKRCAEMVTQLKQRLRDMSPDGRLRCSIPACAWSNPSPEAFCGDLIELHHRQPLSAYPAHGLEMPLGEALKNLAPLCPNCHRLIHARPGGGVYTMDELTVLMQNLGLPCS